MSHIFSCNIMTAYVFLKKAFHFKITNIFYFNELSLLLRNLPFHLGYKPTIAKILYLVKPSPQEINENTSFVLENL